MPLPRPYSPSPGLVFCVLLLAGVLALSSSPAAASMPGENGELLVFGHVDGQRGLYLVDLEPLALVKLPIEAHDLDVYSAAWSPTGSHIAFARYDTGVDQHGLWIHELATGETHLIRVAEPGVEFTDVAWSPSGEEIAVGTIGSDDSRVIRVTSGGALLEEIDLPGNPVWRIEWSPVRPELLLWIERQESTDSQTSVCLLSLDTPVLDCIADEGRWPAWSPDGEQIALGMGPFSVLTIVDRAGNVVHEFGGASGQMATWSPDGNFIAAPYYVGDPEAGQYAIQVVDLNTTNRHGYIAGLGNILDMRWRPQRPEHGFLDVPDDHQFAADIAWLASSGYTNGCNPPLNTEFCPDRPLTRGEAAALLQRTLADQLDPVYQATGFTDTANSEFAADIAWLSSTGITKGCNPPANDRFCPKEWLTRGQTAAFLVRALHYTDDGGGDLFVDDDSSVFEDAIDMLATAGVTKGCNPAEENTKFCPDAYVTRGQMAAFLHRALDSSD